MDTTRRNKQMDRKVCCEYLMQIYATPQIPSGDPVISPATLRKEFLSFILCSIPNTHLSFGASFTYHFPTRRMDVFMHCRDDFRWDERVIAFERNAAELKSPFLIPSLLIRFNLGTRLISLDSFHEKIYQLERKLNIRYDEHSAVDFTNTDFEMMTKNTNRLNTNLAYLVWAVKSTKRELDFLDDVARRYYSMAVDNGIDQAEAEKNMSQLLENQAYLRSWNLSISERAEYLSERAKALVQTVYSGIAQRDAALSQNAAIAAARDSSVMRVIAAITIIFLPATTTAVKSSHFPLRLKIIC
ncbi:hypothetical protein DM02DRAFT_187308 [Periconia macrospinosa]|uniref:Uncharacterized protein n=1 Tax=Periconia macrospinosa TaxID=97972 RepID=A0A2V1E1F1_9PLEO|nr:hypothetical protein DM02DRAFT_187308 [Periconia macrospinosa]